MNCTRSFSFGIVADWNGKVADVFFPETQAIRLDGLPFCRLEVGFRDNDRKYFTVSEN
jgi:hypothetical protein